jgi:MFS family permease
MDYATEHSFRRSEDGDAHPAVFTVTSLACAAAQSITMLNVSRAAQGLGAAIMFAVSLAVLSNAFPRMQDRMKALAAYGATMGGSFAVGPLVGVRSRQAWTGAGSSSSTSRWAWCAWRSCGGTSPSRGIRGRGESTSRDS